MLIDGCVFAHAGVSYVVEVFVSGQKGVTDNPEVLVQLFGRRGDSGKRLLVSSDKEWPFQTTSVNSNYLMSRHFQMPIFRTL